MEGVRASVGGAISDVSGGGGGGRRLVVDD